MQSNQTYVYANSTLDERFGQSERRRAEAVNDLLRLLATLTDLRAQSKQAHWNVRGSLFRELHKLFDDAAASADAFIDRVAERAAALDGYVRGSLQETVAATVLQEYPKGAHAWRDMDHVRSFV